MSVQEERELRERLGGLLDGIEAERVPVASAMRQGKGIRMRRWVAAAAGLAVLAAAGVGIPLALQARHIPPATPRHYHYTETLNPPPGKDAKAGLISSGTQDGRRWSIVIKGHGSRTSVSGVAQSTFGGPLTNPTGPVDFEEGGGGGKGGAYMLVGAVRRDVTKVAITLPGGQIFDLIPVRYGSQRVVGIVIPFGLPIVGAVAYHYEGELAYSVPYKGTILANWYRPGQTGPGRFTKTIAAGVTDGHHWRVIAQFGPWGYCYAFPGGNTCDQRPSKELSNGSAVQQWVCSGLYGGGADLSKIPSLGFVAARSGVRQVELRLSSGGIQRYQTVDVQGGLMFAIVIPARQHVIGSTEYGAAGQVVATTSGKPFFRC